MKRIAIFLIFGAFLALSCNMIVDAVPAEDAPQTEISPDTEPPPAPQEAAADPQATPTPPPPPTETPTPAPSPTPTPTRFFLERITMGSASDRALPRHGLLIAFVFPLLALGIPWTIMEFFVVRYVQPRSIDLSEVLIKAQDGLFIRAAISLTARRSLTLASTRMSWPRVRDLVEKTLEQELLHEALNFPTLDDLERNLKNIAEKFNNLSVVQELSDDFGVEVMRFNIETRYPQETMDALNRKAEASAGGTAYLAYAAAAHLDPDSEECRELYRIYQETSGQVDAARNLGGGISRLAGVFGQKPEREELYDDVDV